MNMDMDVEKPLVTSSLSLKVFRWIQNTIFHQVLAVVSIYAIWYGLVSYNYLWSWHLILSSLGYVPLMAEAILLFAGDNVWSQEITRKTKYWIHGILLLLATILLIAGNSIASYYIQAGFHFNTAHGITGLISMILVFISLFFGYAAANPQYFSHIARPVWCKFLHNLIGIAGYVIGMISLILGYYTHWFQFYTSAETRMAAAIATGVVTLWSLYAACISLYDQFRNIIGR